MVDVYIAELMMCKVGGSVQTCESMNTTRFANRSVSAMLSPSIWSSVRC